MSRKIIYLFTYLSYYKASKLQTLQIILLCFALSTDFLNARKIMSMDPIYLLLHSNDLLNIIKCLWLPLTVIFQVPPLGPGIKINRLGKKSNHGDGPVHSFTIAAQALSSGNSSPIREITKNPNNKQWMSSFTSRQKHLSIQIDACTLWPRNPSPDTNYNNNVWFLVVITPGLCSTHNKAMLCSCFPYFKNYTFYFIL